MGHISPSRARPVQPREPDVFQKTLGVNDFYFGGEDFEFPIGHIQLVGKSQAPMFRGEKPGETRFAPQWTLHDVARHAVDFWLSTEDLPTPENRVTLARDGNIVIDYRAKQRPRQGTPLPQAQGDAGRPRDAPRAPLPHHAYLKNEIPVAGCAQCRRARAGSAPTPSSSVLNADCRAHELDNLYVVDTSFFPSMGAVNPALTAMANAAAGRRPPAGAHETRQPESEPVHVA